MDNRIELLRSHIDGVLLDMTDTEDRRCAYLHLYGVSQACALIALKRGENVELATMAGMLHDFHTYKSGSHENHAVLGAILAREVLNELKITNDSETDMICSAIHNHSSKSSRHSAFDEVLIDADVMQHSLYNYTQPVMEHENERFNNIIGEFGLTRINIDVSQITIDTERLILRSWQETDLNDFYEYASVPGVGEMAGWEHHKSIDTSKMILKSFIDKKEVFAIIHRKDNKAIGSLGIHDSWANNEEQYKHLKSKEIGYVLSKEYWGQGIVPEAVKAVIDYCFINFDIDAFTCGHFKENNQSRRVIEKCGFSLVKESEYYAKQLQRTFDDLKYILLRENWEKND
jgi:RimJ/RimL family protein N-acetyltransferase/HD superfamily phosphohydrolase YqeK